MVTWMSIEGHRRLVQVIPNPVQEWWHEWELRGLILLSLVSQTILIVLGNRTKYKPNILTRLLLWFSYLLADWIAIIAIGVISSNIGDYYNKDKHTKNVNPQLLAFWTPFFLMHLGGPDTITAYALEDNELWLRHFVGLLSQTALTIYVINLSWKDNWLSHHTIPILIIGIIKYGEKTWSLYCASMKNLRDSFLHSIDTSRKSVQQQESRTNSRFCGLLNYIIARCQLLNFMMKTSLSCVCFNLGDQRTYLRAIHIFVSLFVDLILNPQEITKDRENFMSKKSYAYDLVNYELKLMYDVFYTKAFANYGIFGFMSRLGTLITTIIVLVKYVNSSEKNKHSVVDIIITYLLLVGALLEGIYAFILVTFSRWTIHYFLIKGLGAFCCIPMFVQNVKLLLMTKEDQLSLLMGQCNFFNLICNKNLITKGSFFSVNKFKQLQTVMYCLTSEGVTHCLTSECLQTFVMKRLQDKSKNVLQSNPLGSPGYRNLLFGKNVSIFTTELEFHRTIITWHIATNLLFYSNDESNHKLDRKENCKAMSDYMFYLLVKQRHMLPVGAGMITLRDTVIEIINFFERVQVTPQQDNLVEICRILILHDTTTITEDESLKMKSTSILFHACAIVKQLIVAENRHQTWKFLEELWVEIISYASSQCRVDMHAQQLRRGPEFLSHVWLFHAHLGLLDQFQFVGYNSNKTPSTSL
ncbi:hypothetical protein VNO78_25810 [Psophocarpus tetragonolobus]|uniref:DUF4220 domain-containing protein n=1 Tax=Psophocarpus tetragonolobus TaxID=3891 RepID=A0AAN9S739_PSOTE